MAVSRLLQLPRELRDTIYILVLSTPKVVELFDPQPGLIGSCIQLRDECLPLYLSLNDFAVRIPDNRTAPLIQHLRGCDPSIRYIHSLTLDCIGQTDLDGESSPWLKLASALFCVENPVERVRISMYHIAFSQFNGKHTGVNRMLNARLEGLLEEYLSLAAKFSRLHAEAIGAAGNIEVGELSCRMESIRRQIRV